MERHVRMMEVSSLGRFYTTRHCRRTGLHFSHFSVYWVYLRSFLALMDVKGDTKTVNSIIFKNCSNDSNCDASLASCRRCAMVAAPLLHRAAAPLLHRGCCAIAAPLLRRCWPLLHRCCTVAAPLLRGVQSHNCVRELRSLVQQQQTRIFNLQGESSELKLHQSELKHELQALKVSQALNSSTSSKLSS